MRHYSSLLKKELKTSLKAPSIEPRLKSTSRRGPSFHFRLKRRCFFCQSDVQPHRDLGNVCDNHCSDSQTLKGEMCDKEFARFHCSRLRKLPQVHDTFFGKQPRVPHL